MAQGGREKNSLREKTEKRGRGKSLHKVGETTKENQEGRSIRDFFEVVSQTVKEQRRGEAVLACGFFGEDGSHLKPSVSMV